MSADGIFDLATVLLVLGLEVLLALVVVIFIRFPFKLHTAIFVTVFLGGALLGITVLTYGRGDRVGSLAHQRPATAALATAAQPAATPALPSRAEASATEPPTLHARLNYTSIGTVSSIMSPDPAVATRAQGASFLGFDFVPAGPGSVLRIHAVVNAYALQENDVVVAIFREDEARPLKLESKHVAANGRVDFDLSVETPANGKPHIEVERARMGVAQPGTVVINGPEGGKPSDVATPFISIDDAAA